MKKLDFLAGEKVIKNSGETFRVVSVNSWNNIITLDDGKIGYDLKKSIDSNSLRFKSEEIQNKVEKLLKESDTIIDIGINPLPPDFIIERAIRLFKGVGGKRNISNTHSRDFHFLRSGVAYGKKALTIYHSCCKELGFDITKSSRFDLQQGLYAHNATPEGYGVWMLPHSDLTGDAKSWANIIEGDYIYEVWNKVDYEDHKDVRIAFAKQGDGEYVFMGIYELQKVENINQRKDGVYITVKKIYKKVLEVYPEI